MRQVFDYVEAEDVGADVGAPASVNARGGWRTATRDVLAEWTKTNGAPNATQLANLKRLAKRNNDVFAFEGHRSPSRNDERDFNTAQNLISFYIRNRRGPDNGDPLTGKLGQPETTALINASVSAVPGASSFFSNIVHTVEHAVTHPTSIPLGALNMSWAADAIARKVPGYSAIRDATPIGRSTAAAGDFLHHLGSQSITSLGNSSERAALTREGIAAAAKGNGMESPLWNIAKTGAAFIPGVSNPVSAGMANAAAVGRTLIAGSTELAHIAGSIAPDARPGFQIGLGAVHGHLLEPRELAWVREQVPGGDAGKGAFDAAVALSASPAERDAIANGLSAQARATFTRAMAAHANGAPSLSRATRAAPGRSRAVRVQIHEPAHSTRPFPRLNHGANRAATSLMATPSLRSVTAAKVGSTLRIDNRDVRSAIAAFLEKFGAQRELAYSDVGEFETFDQAARRHQVNVPQDIGYWPGDTGELHVVQLPPLPVSRDMLHGLYRRGDSNIRRSLLAHELLAHVARNTGELEGTEWVIRGNGDWPSKVAETVVGNGSRWKELLPLNPSFHVMANGNIPQWTKGTRVQLPPGWFPSAVPIAAAPATPAPSGGPPFASAYPLGYPSATYSIKDGDTGEKVAALITGHKERWRELLVTNPNLADPKYGIALYAGKPLKLPSSWVKAQPSPAIAATQNPPPPLPEAPSMPSPVLTSSPPVSPPPVADGRIGSPPPTPPFSPPVTTPAPMSPPSAPASVASGPVVTGTTEQIATVQIMLASFFRDHPDATYALSGAPYGADAADFAGVWTERTTAAFLGFERWWNAKRKTPQLEADGLPDGNSVQSLINQTLADGGSVDSRSPIQLSVKGAQQKAATVPRKKSGGGGLAPLALLLALGS